MASTSTDAGKGTSLIPFYKTLEVTQLDSHVYAATFPKQCCIGTVPNGGYVASCFLQVARTHLAPRGQAATIAAHFSYLTRAEAGPALFLVEEAKLGRQTSVLHVALYQHALVLDSKPWITPGASRREVVAYITNSTPEVGLSLPTAFELHSPPPPPPPVDLARLRRVAAGVAPDDDPSWRLADTGPGGLGPMGFHYSLQSFHYFQPRRAGSGSKKSVLDMWVCLASGEPFDTVSLGYVADCWPYIVEAYRPPPPGKKKAVGEGQGEVAEAAGRKEGKDEEGEEPFPFDKRFWYPTLVLNLDVKKPLPPPSSGGGPDFLFLRVLAKGIRNGRLDLEVIVADPAGELVALAHHVNLIVDIERNLAERSRETKTKKEGSRI